MYQLNMKMWAKLIFSCTVILLLSPFMSSVRGQPGSETTAGGHNDSDPVHGDTKARAAADLKESILNRPVVKQKVSPSVSLPSDYDTAGVSVYLQLNSVLNVDDSQQIMTSTLVVQITWRDSFLSWSPSNYSGVKIISMDLNLIWTPNVFVLNSPALKNDLLSYAHHLNVQSNGTVYALTTITMDTMCSMDHSKFPYDSQLCPIVVFTLDNQISIDVTTAHMDPTMSSALTQKFNWELVSVEQTMIDYKAVNVFIPAMQVGLRRRTTFCTVCLVTPMVLTSYTNTLVFLVPLQSGEKVSFLITLLVSGIHLCLHQLLHWGHAPQPGLSALHHEAPAVGHGTNCHCSPGHADHN